MFEKVLVPVDFSQSSRIVMNAVKEIPDVKEIVLLHVVYNRYPSEDPAIIYPDVEEARATIADMKKSFAMPGLEITDIVEEITGGDISEVINQTATRLGVSLIAMGRRGTGIIETLLLGSVASDILRYGKTSLLLIPTPFKTDENLSGTDSPHPALFSHIMICTDFSKPEIGSICLEEMPWIQRVSLFHSVTTGDSKDEVQSAVAVAEHDLGNIRDAFMRRGIPASIHVSVGSAAEEILTFSRQEDISLIVIKSVGKKSFLNALIGSTSAPVARNTGKPVLILKRFPSQREQPA
jgi:nucleotide-binding universal stress UspA family protein